MRNLTETEIIESIRSGKDSRVFSYLYEKIFPKVKAYIIKNGGDNDESKDIFQDALLVFYSKVKGDRYVHTTEIDGFIYAVSRNLWLNRFKVKFKKSNHTLDEVVHPVDEDIERVIILREREQSLNDLLGKLGEVCQELLINIVFHKNTMAEICEKMGFANENVAKTKNYKCKQRLINLVGNKNDLTELLR